MSLWATLLGRNLPAPVAAEVPVPVHAARRRFAIGDDHDTWQALVTGTLAGRVSRREASAVPSVKRARDLIAGTIGTLPLGAVNAAGEPVDRVLLAQPEQLSGLVRSVTITRTVEDLLYDAQALWLVITRDATGFPTAVQRVEYGQWSQDLVTGVIRVRPPEVNALGREVPAEDCVVFTSPNDPLLTAGAAAIRNLLTLEATASLYAATPEPSSYFTATDGVDPADPAEVERFLSDYETARRNRSTAYLPAAVQLNHAARMTAEELQLIAAREFAVTEVARLTGIDADWLSVNTTSRTYANAQDARRAFVDFTLAPYLHAVEERLSLGDCTPRGQRVRFNLDAFLRADTAERYASYSAALAGGWLTLPEIRDLEDRPPLEAPA